MFMWILCSGYISRHVVCFSSVSRHLEFRNVFFCAMKKSITLLRQRTLAPVFCTLTKISFFLAVYLLINKVLFCALLNSKRIHQFIRVTICLANFIDEWVLFFSNRSIFIPNKIKKEYLQSSQ
jgi:hypothetical protein